MPTFDEKFIAVKANLITDIQLRIQNIWETHSRDMFIMWLIIDADHEFGQMFIDHFKQEFPNYVSQDGKENLLFIMGKQICGVLYTCLKFNKNYKIDSIHKFASIFLQQQLNDWTNTDDSIYDYDETSDAEDSE